MYGIALVIAGVLLLVGLCRGPLGRFCAPFFSEFAAGLHGDTYADRKNNWE